MKQNKEKKSEEKEVILNFMFSGNYLENNIGHEIINMYKADDSLNKEGNHGGYYVYLCHNGECNPFTHPAKNIERIFFVRRTGNSKELEILGFTDGELEYVHSDNGIRYGGVEVSTIFKTNVKQQSKCITFKAEKIIRPNDTLIINQNQSQETIDNIFNPSRNLRIYIKVGSSAYDFLQQNVVAPHINDCEKKLQPIFVDDKESFEVTSTEIYGIQNRELSYSNAIKFFFDRYPNIFTSFLKGMVKLHYPGDKDIDYGEYRGTLREWRNIDLLIRYEHALFIIENKIFSELNGKLKDDYTDWTQLEKYKDLMDSGNIQDSLLVELRKIPHKFYFVLTPDHNNIDLSNHIDWKKIHYSDLKTFLECQEQKLQDFFLTDFLHSISCHCDKDYNYTSMRKRFIRAILNAKK